MDLYGLDPSAAMLDLAKDAVQAYADRIDLVEDLIDAAPERQHDGAVCLLTLHFLDRAERKRTLREIWRRLKPGARLVVAHHSAPAGSPLQWLARSALFADRERNDSVLAQGSAVAMAARLPLLSVVEEEDLLREAGFTDVELFYAAFSFRGWVASRGPAAPNCTLR